jgi:hypothetical protein
MAKTYEPIATTTLGSAAASYTFSSIPATYTDLILVLNGSTSASNATSAMQYNSDTGSNYSYTGINGDGSTASSFRVTSTTNIAIGEMRTYNCTNIVQIQNYSNSTTYKTNLMRANSASDYVQTSVGLWRNTAAINAIKVLTNFGNFNTGTTFTLYGIKSA